MIKLGKKIKRGTRPDAYHRLRIRCKALRYALEFHADVYGPATRRVIRDLVSLQDILGDHQDADVAVEWLRGLISAPGARLPAHTAFVVGRLVERYERRAEKLRRKFRKRFSSLSARSWKRLDRALTAAAPPLPKPPAAARTRASEPGDTQEPVGPSSPSDAPPAEATASESLPHLPTVEPRGDTEH